MCLSGQEDSSPRFLCSPSPPLPTFPPSCCTPTPLLSEKKCEAFSWPLTCVHQVSQRSPGGLDSLARVKSCSGTHPFISFIPFPDSLPHSFYGASWNFLPDKPVAPKSLSEGLLLGEPQFKPTGPHTEAATAPTLLCLPFWH